MLSSQRVFEAIERFVLNRTSGGGLHMHVQKDAPLSLDEVFELEPLDDAMSVLPSSPSMSEALPGGDSVVGSSFGGAAAARAAQPWKRGGLANRWYSLALTDAWQLTDPGLHDNVLAISLQGLVNRHEATLYLEYPADWAYGYTAAVREWVATSRKSNYTTLDSVGAALKAFSGVPAGYVLWDTDGPTSARGTHNSARSSLLVALTAAGQLNALVATPAQQPMLQAAGLQLLGDYSKRFRGLSDAQVHAWAKGEFWDKASKSEVMWMGGECNTQVRPAQADVGISHGLFFTDLSTLLDAPWEEENAAADALIAEASAACEASGGPPLIVLGWHSYCKDYEHTFITMASKHGGRNHGLNTNPNLSFMSQLPLPDSWVFKNRPPPRRSAVTRGAGPSDTLQTTPRATLPSVAMVFVQTDGLGLGAWTKPGRGAIPYSWEVTLPDLEIQPAILQMFYEQATANDTFIAALSGPGYLYPKAVPPSKLVGLLELAGRSMDTLDLHAMVTFDASLAATQSHTVTGDCTLSAEVVAAYTAHLPQARAILNGYGPTFTFASSSTAAGNVSTVSFDYYLDPGGTVDSIAADLISLAELNPTAPYLLVVHVREWSTVGRVTEVLTKLPSTFSLLPAHEWIPLADEHPTFRTRFH